MNFLLVLFSMLLFTNCANTQSNKVTEAVKTTFSEMYPGENDPDWELDKNGYWEANFKIDGIKYRADFEPSGKWIETESSIDKKDLPEPVKRKLKEDYDDFKISEIEMVMHHSKGTFYDVEIYSMGKKVDLEFDSSGNRLN